MILCYAICLDEGINSDLIGEGNGKGMDFDLSDEQKQSYLRPVCYGYMIPSIQFTELETDPKAITTNIVPEKNYYAITEAKRFSTFAERKGYAIHRTSLPIND